jgi:hypothetical protein
LHLIQERKLEPKSVMVQMAALRFLYLKVLRRNYSRDDIPLPRTPHRQIPVVLSIDEVSRLIAPDLRYRTILMTCMTPVCAAPNSANSAPSTSTRSA